MLPFRGVRLADLAAQLGCRLEGDGAVEIARVETLDAAGPGDLSFLSNPKYARQLAVTRASAVIVGEDVTAAPCAVLRARRPYLAMAEAVRLLTPPAQPQPGISPLAAIHPSATLGADVSVGPFVAIGARVHVGPRTALYPHVVIGDDASVGADCVVHAHASIREGVTLGDRVVLQDAAVIGSDGFGFAQRAD
jgi:UDP-3-O-[3-hydroxymyristoyl] glucosamine N-acyltransferase